MAKSRRSRNSSSAARRWAILSLIALTAVASALYSFGAPLFGNAQAATAYSARVACSCRFVAQRELADCNKDKMPGMEWVSLSEDTEARSVTATIPFLASETAVLRDGYGCVLQPWQRDS